MMEIDRKLYSHFAPGARETEVETLSVGLGYTAVTTKSGGIGISYTSLGDRKSCSVHKNYKNYEGLPATELLAQIESADPLMRSMALALINALNHEAALALPAEKNNDELFDLLDVGAGTRVAMVGYFSPLLGIFENRKAELRIIDNSRGIGSKDDFYRDLGEWAEVLVLTSTSILNSTMEEILAATAAGVRTVLLGPSTPLVPCVFSGMPVAFLAGTVPLEKEEVLRAVRHGTGTPVIQKYGRKVLCPVPQGAPR
jgi:uncharacterized protein (DUF4213/DUF364 family)